jgi:hypothetical protein
VDLLGRHIFRSGTWNGQEFTNSDLDDIVNNFAKLREVHHVPLKFGHDADHSGDKSPDGQPAIGWIERVYRKGSDLFADFSHVPKVVMEAIDAKRFRTVSVEVMKNTKLDGKKIKTWFLDAVALLGADQPAVAGLKDLADLTVLSRSSFEGGSRVLFSKAGKFYSQHEDSEMDPKDLNAAIDKAMAPLRDSIDELKSDNAELKKDNDAIKAENATLKTATEDRDKEDAAAKIKASRKAATDVLDGAVKQKAITPAQREVHEKTFGIKDDEAVQKLDIADLKVAVGFKEDKDGNKSKTFQRNDEDDDLDNISLDQQVVNATRKVMANKPDLDYVMAQDIALGADPKLAEAYLNSNGVLNADGGVDR